MPARLQDLERSCLRHLRAEGLSPNTLRLHGQAVTFFWRWLETEGRAATSKEQSRPAVREWLALLDKRSEAGTVKTRHRELFGSVAASSMSRS